MLYYRPTSAIDGVPWLLWDALRPDERADHVRWLELAFNASVVKRWAGTGLEDIQLKPI